MACNSFPKPLLPGHCRSRRWSFSVGTRQVMGIEPAEHKNLCLLMQLGAKGLGNKLEHLSCGLKDVKDLTLRSVPYIPLTLIVFKVLCDFLPFSFHPAPIQVHPATLMEFCLPIQTPQVQQWNKISPKLLQRMSPTMQQDLDVRHQEPLTSSSNSFSKNEDLCSASSLCEAQTQVFDLRPLVQQILRRNLFGALIFKMLLHTSRRVTQDLCSKY